MTMTISYNNDWLSHQLLQYSALAIIPSSSSWLMAIHLYNVMYSMKTGGYPGWRNGNDYLNLAISSNIVLMQCVKANVSSGLMREMCNGSASYCQYLS